MKQIIFFLFCVFTLAFTVSVQAQSEVKFQSVYDQAKQAYYDKNYKEAETQFLSLLTIKPDNGYLHYNLGNTYFKLGELGKAIQYYEKAKLTIPRDSDLQFNLNIAQTKLVDKVQDSFADYMIKTFYFWARFVNLFEYQILFVLFSLLFWLIVYWRFFKHQPVFTASFIFVLICYAYLGFGFYLKNEKENTGHYGVIIKSEVDVKSSYLEKEQSIFNLHEGTKVRIIDKQFFNEQENWLRIELPQGQKGWVNVDAIGVI